MTLNSPSGVCRSSVLHYAKPSLIWSPYRAARAVGNGMQGGGRVDMTIQNIDTSTNTHEFSVWHDGKERFEIKTELANPEEVLGSVGDFSDGYVQNYWSTSWSTANLGFGVIAPTTAGVLGQTGSIPDIISGSHGNTTYVDTDEGQDSVIEKSNTRSASYIRVFQVLIKSEEGHSPDSGNVEIGLNTSAGTRTVTGNTWYRQLPGSGDWYAVIDQMAAGSGTIYISIKFKQGTGRWYVACPTWYSAFSTFENITRGPIPGGLSYRRGQYGVYTTNSEFKLSPSGWLGMSISLPDRSDANGHLDYAGASGYGFMGLMSWQSGNFRIRTIMSSSLNHLAVQMDESTVSFAYLDFGDDWDDFEQIGMVVTWGISGGQNYAYLYVNGRKVDAEASVANWYPQTLADASVYIGTNGSGGSAADCWISKLALGKQPLDRNFARTLSTYFKETAKGGRIGAM